LGQTIVPARAPPGGAFRANEPYRCRAGTVDAQDDLRDAATAGRRKRWWKVSRAGCGDAVLHLLELAEGIPRRKGCHAVPVKKGKRRHVSWRRSRNINLLVLLSVGTAIERSESCDWLWDDCETAGDGELCCTGCAFHYDLARFDVLFHRRANAPTAARSRRCLRLNIARRPLLVPRRRVATTGALKCSCRCCNCGCCATAFRWRNAGAFPASLVIVIITSRSCH